MNQIHIQGELVVCVFCISEIIIIEAVIYGLPRVNNLLGMMRGVNHLRFFLLDTGAVGISMGLEPWIRSLWGNRLVRMRQVIFLKKGIQTYLGIISNSSRNCTIADNGRNSSMPLQVSPYGCSSTNDIFLE